jgi:hypothetical protein
MKFNIQKLHDRDFNLWVEQTAIALKNRDIKAMDWDNLIEEIEDMGASQKRALRSYTQRLIEHILKLNYWDLEKERCGDGWRIEIANFREQIANILEDSPSLNNYLEDNYLTWFDRSIKKLKATKTFDLSDFQIISLEQILKDDFFLINA